MKKVLLLGIALLTAYGIKATPTITNSGNTLVITVNAHGDLASSNFTQEQLKSTNVKIVTADGVKLSKTDFVAFFGGSYTTPPFSMITDLDMGQAELERDDVIVTLGHNSPKLNDGKELGTLVLPECLQSTAFSFNDNKSKWTTIIFPDAKKDANKGTTVIRKDACSGDTWLKKLIIGTSVNSIQAQAFGGCTNLTEVDYLYGVEHVSSQAFTDCTGLTTVILPESLTEIGERAFGGCTNLATLRLPNSLKTIKTQAFDGTAISVVVIPASVENIGYGAFGGNNSRLTDVYVLGTQTKAVNQSFQPTKITYGYSYSGKGEGETVSLSAFTTTTGRYTVLHYPKEAYEAYVNKFTRVLGTSDYASSGYSQYYNKWVVDADGNKFPVQNYGLFDGTGGDYAGWWNFMLTSQIKGTYKDERLVESKWYSVCFPFSMTKEAIANAFGSGTDVREFTGVDIKEAGDGNKNIVLKFQAPVTEMKAHHPYMIHPGSHRGSYNMIVDVEVDTDTDGDNFAAKLKSEAVSYTADGVTYTFIGSHAEGAKVPMYSYYYYSGNDAKWANGFYKAMRSDAVFTPHTAVVALDKDNGVSGSAKRAVFSLDGETTGIDGITAQTDNKVKRADGVNVYDIYGRLVRRGSESLEGLPAGVYIVNGKKYMVR